MDRTVKIVAALLGILISAGIIGAAVSRSVAAQEIRPVENRVTRLETQQGETARRLERMDDKLDRILERVK